MFSTSFCRFSAIQPMCQNTPKMLPTCSQNLPKFSPRSPTWRYLGPSWSQFAPILPLMLAILPVLLAILAPTCPTSALKMPEKCHLGANIAKKVLQPPLQAPQNTKKTMLSCFLPSSPCAKILPKYSQHAPKTSQVEPTITNLALSWPILVAICSQLGPNLAHLAPTFAPTCGEIPRKSFARRQKVPQDLPGPFKDKLLASPAPSRHPKIPQKLLVSYSFCKFSAILSCQCHLHTWSQRQRHDTDHHTHQNLK